jgi:hypothetical protein
VRLNLLPGSGATNEPTDDELAALAPAGRERTLASWDRDRRWVCDRQGYADLRSTRPQTPA